MGRRTPAVAGTEAEAEGSVDMAKEVFGKFAQIYDRARRQLVPCFDEFYDALISQIPHDDNAKLRILRSALSNSSKSKGGQLKSFFGR